MSTRQICVLCSAVPEDILVLVCNHSLCLPCSAQMVSTNTVNGQHQIQCKTCNQSTYLAPQLYKELIANLQTKLTSLPLKSRQVNNKRLKQNEYPNKMSKGRFLQSMCSNHPEYVTIYVCKTCCNAIICPECVINGIHKNHQVNTVQREGQAIVNSLKRQLSVQTNKINDLTSILANKSSEVQQRIEQLQKLQSVARRQYKSIKKSIDEQEFFVLKKCGELVNLHRQELSYFQASVKNELSIIESNKQNVIDLLHPFLDDSDSTNIKAYNKPNLLIFIKQYQVYNRRHHAQVPRTDLILQRSAEKEYDINTLRNRIKNIQNINFNQESRNEILNALANANIRQQTIKKPTLSKKVKPKVGLFTLI